MTLTERFWGRVTTGNGCWLWTGNISNKGYGTIWLDGTNALAHRVAYLLAHGSIPDNAQIDHLCRTRACVRPSHLEAVTCRENLFRSPDTHASRNAAKTHCPQGHPYSGENLHIRSGGGRKCRACARIQDRARRIRKLQEGATA